MAHSVSRGEDKDHIETIIDRHGLAAVLDLISDICHEKAEHIETNYPGSPQTTEWEFNALAVAELQGRVVGG